MNNRPNPCAHGRHFCIECHGQTAPACPVFGCTIPRGIPHEHPAGVSAVMRDPAAPLSAYERAELLALRREAALRLHAQQMQRQQHMAIQQAQYMQNPWGMLGLGMQYNPHTATGQAHAMDQLMRNHRDEALFQVAAMAPTVYVVPEDAPMVPGRKLRDALLGAGQGAYEQNKAKAAIVCNELSRKAVLDLYRARDMQRPTGEKAVDLVFNQPKRRTLAQSVGKFMTWMFGIPALLLAAFAIGHYFGWWV